MRPSLVKLVLHVSVKSDLINVFVSLGEYIEPFSIHVYQPGVNISENSTHHYLPD